jgi:hypothetical protein
VISWLVRRADLIRPVTICLRRFAAFAHNTPAIFGVLAVKPMEFNGLFSLCRVSLRRTLTRFHIILTPIAETSGDAADPRPSWPI